MREGISGAIIAAGRGERLRQAVGGTPKPLVDLAGRSLLERQIDAMRELGLCPIHVIVNTETARMLENAAPLPPDVMLCVRDTPNSLASLLMLGERIGHRRFMLATVDAVLRPAAMAAFVARALTLTDPGATPALDGALGVVRWRGDKRPLFLEFGDDGLIRRLGGEEAPFVTAGVYCFNPRIWAYAEEARALGLDALRRYLALLVDRGMKLAAIEIEGVIDVDEVADLAAARAMLRES